MRSGFVALIGRPNVGKSTLLNRIVGEKVSIVSKVAQTTRFQIRAILNDARGQIVFVDTPGIHLQKHRLGSSLNKMAITAKDEADVVVYMVDLTRAPEREEENIMDGIVKSTAPVIMALNKMDEGQGYVNDFISAWKSKAALALKDKPDPVKFYIPVSALTGKNIDELLDAIYSLLPLGPACYPDDILTDFPQKLAIADIIREKFLELTHKEIPHYVGVLTDEITPRKNKLLYIRATIFIDSVSQKKIIIGERGQLLKKAGELARKDLEALLGKRVFLDLWVKVKQDWREDVNLLKELGYLL